MSKVMWLCFTAASVQGALALWLIREAKTASDGDLDQCHQPLVTDQQDVRLYGRTADVDMVIPHSQREELS